MPPLTATSPSFGRNTSRPLGMEHEIPKGLSPAVGLTVTDEHPPDKEAHASQATEVPQAKICVVAPRDEGARFPIGPVNDTVTRREMMHRPGPMLVEDRVPRSLRLKCEIEP